MQSYGSSGESPRRGFSECLDFRADDVLAACAAQRPGVSLAHRLADPACHQMPKLLVRNRIELDAIMHFADKRLCHRQVGGSDVGK